ncbi:hypothetical protein EZV62_023710 [Acer yangbiense]|uniref:Uncharacterized protein n=1 Tax=Acer yangbiense TaxID=1000413 RepID=A0A5C7H4M5_9ROSI|nr:hypothetical protein EZV62_023710 [Acer yangbiense]
MNADEIAKLCDALTINDMDAPAQTLDANLKDMGIHRLGLCLVGKVLVSKLINKDIFIEVQIHNLPLLCMTKEIGFFLGRMIGEVSDYDTGTSMDGSGSFLRVRVKVPMDKPLRRSLRVDVLSNVVLVILWRAAWMRPLMVTCLWTIRKLGVWLRASSPPKRMLTGMGMSGPRNWNKPKSFGGANSDKGHYSASADNWRWKPPELMKESGKPKRGSNGRLEGMEESGVKMSRKSYMVLDANVINKHTNVSRNVGICGQMIDSPNKILTVELVGVEGPATSSDSLGGLTQSLGKDMGTLVDDFGVLCLSNESGLGP